MFDTKPYRPYVALMRELHLPREFEEGDWYVITPDDGEAYCIGTTEVETAAWEADAPVWLPRLDQWLAMTNAPRVSFWRTDDGVVARAVLPGADEDDEPVTHREVGRTYEEAAARLWCAVTGRAVTA